MKILLAIILIFPIFNIVAQNPVQPKDSTVGKDELIIISPEKKVHSDTSELMIIRDSSQKHKEANISELFIVFQSIEQINMFCTNTKSIAYRHDAKHCKSCSHSFDICCK